MPAIIDSSAVPASSPFRLRKLISTAINASSAMMLRNHLLGRAAACTCCGSIDLGLHACAASTLCYSELSSCAVTILAIRGEPHSSCACAQWQWRGSQRQTGGGGAGPAVDVSYRRYSSARLAHCHCRPNEQSAGSHSPHHERVSTLITFQVVGLYYRGPSPSADHSV